MTQLSQKTVNCPNCNALNKIIYYASINTCLDYNGTLISQVLDGTLNTSICNNCGNEIRLVIDILINSPKGMFYLNPKDNIEYKKEMLKSYDVLSEKGIIKAGPLSQFAEAKNRLNKKQEYIPKPRPPPAPKVSPNTRRIHELIEELDRKISKNKKIGKENKAL